MYPLKQMPAVAKVILDAAGGARVQTTIHEIGQGVVTAMTQIAAEALGLPLDRVQLEFGDTTLPYGGMTVGPMSTLPNGAAIHEAAQAVRKTLLKRVARD